MSAGRIWRVCLTGSVGAFLCASATLLFDLRLHVGSYAVTGASRYLIAAVAGAAVALLMRHTVRDELGI